MAVDGSGAAYVTGRTTSYQKTFPVTPGQGLNTRFKGVWDAFVVKFTQPTP